jgi:hypothetical protein
MAPLQGPVAGPPLAVHAVALLVVHDNSTDCPTWIALGVAVKLDTAAGGALCVTSTLAVLGKLVPPAPVHVSTYRASPAVSMGPMAVPELCAGTLPLQPSAGVPPVAVQPVAARVDQLAVADPPTCTVLGVTLNERIVGAGGVLSTSTVTLVGVLVPPGPLHVSV